MNPAEFLYFNPIQGNDRVKAAFGRQQEGLV